MEQASDQELDSAEAWLEGLGVDYDPALVRVYRLHILQRFHDYAAAAPAPSAEAAPEQARRLLQRAHDDFVGSDAQRQAALRIHRQAARGATAEIPVTGIGRRGGK
ncbi:MAG: nitrogenase-stabilizing/protective protein NifW [Halorhodospira sp.]